MTINETVRYLTFDCKAHLHSLRHVYIRKIQKNEYIYMDIVEHI